MRWWWVLSVCVWGLVACDGERSYPVSDRREPNATCHALPAPPPQGVVRTEPALEGLGDHRMAVQLVQSPADPDRWYLALKTGQILSTSANEGGEQTVLDIADRLNVQPDAGSGFGLLSLALHPDFGSNGEAYLVYTAPRDEGGYYSRLARFTREPDGAFDPASEEVLLDIAQSSGQHTGDHVAFGPDGYLYYSIGDDRRTAVNAQSTTIRQGAVLRLDVDGTDPDLGTPYAIPPDNPFPEGVGGAPEMFAWGLRNPWRFTVDHVENEIWVGDVGQDRREELNLLANGSNYGWPLREGTLCFLEDPCDDPSFVDPVLEVSHTQVKSITPGYRYIQGDIPALEGRFVFGDYISGRIYSADLDASEPTVRLELESGVSPVSFARGADGSLYVVHYAVEGGQHPVHRFVPNDPEPSDFPERLSETGCVDPSDPRLPAPGLVPYEPIAKLWSDGADKERYFAIPDDQRIGVGSDGDFDFPNGSVLVKHFQLEGRYHETRLLMRHGGNWYGYSYEWNDAQTDAVLVEGSKAVTLPSGVRWTYPSRSACMECHTAAAGRTLGLEARQLHWARPFEPGGEPQDQLAWLLEHDYFRPHADSLDDVGGDLTPLPAPFGASDLQQRVKAYLHANCAMCHRPNGPSPADIDLRFDTAFADMGLCNAEPQAALWEVDAPIPEQRIVLPGEPTYSTLYLRMSVLGLFRMPPLATEVVDEEAVAMVQQWITGMEGCP